MFKVKLYKVDKLAPYKYMYSTVFLILIVWVHCMTVVNTGTPFTAKT